MNRKNSAVVRIICWSIAAVALSILLITGLLGHWNFSLFNFGGGSTWTYKDSSKYSVGPASLPAGKIKNIEVNWLDGSVTLTTTQDKNLSVSETSRKKLKEEEQLHYYLKGDTLLIEYRASKKNIISNWSGDLNKKLEIQIPKETASGLKSVITGGVSSDIKMDNLTSERIQADTTSGDIYLENTMTDILSVSTVSGELTARSLTVNDEVSSDTVSGDTILDGSVKAADFSSVSGSLSIISAICPQRVQADTTSGDVLINIPDNSGFNVSFDTVSGDMESDFSTKGSDSHLTYGNGENNFQASTVSGDFVIKQSH